MNKRLAKNLLQTLLLPAMLGGLFCSQLALADVAPLSVSGNKNKVKAVVDAAIANDMYVIIDWRLAKLDDHQPRSSLERGYPSLWY